MNMSDDIAKLDYYKTKSIPKDPTVKDLSNPFDSSPLSHILEPAPFPKPPKKNSKFISSKLPSTQTITSPMHGSNATRQQQSLKRNIPLSFGGYSGATGEFQDLIDMNEFPEELPKNSNTPKNQTHIKNMASYNSNNNEIGLLPTLRPGSLIPASGIETLEKKLEKLNTELLGDREGQKSLFTKLEQVRSEKESLIKEMEKMRLGYEKRIDGLKEELADINKLRLELDYKDQQNLSQKAFFESELSRLEDEKAEIERNSLMKPERDFPSSHALEQDLWKARYQGLLSEMSVLEQEKKGFSRKIEEMKEESRRKEESNSLMVQNYEGKLANLAQELFRNKPEGDLVRKLKEENEMMLKELTETKLKLFRLEVLIPENSHLESSLSSLRQEYSQLQDQIVLLEKELEGKIQDLDLRNQQTISFYETKLRSFEDLQRDFLLVNSENERLINLLHEQEKGKEDFIEKKEIQEEIDGIMRKFLRERELFESLLEEEREFGRGKEELIKEKEEIIKEKEEIIKEKEDRIRVLEGERFFIKEKEDRIKLLEEEIGILRENNERIRVLEGERFFMKEKNDRYRLLEEERALITENNDIKRHSDGKISHNNEKTERKEFLEEGSLTNEKNDKIKDLQVIIMLISSENDRLFGIIEELEHETEFIKRNTSYNEENKKLLLENKDLKESLAINSNNNVNVKEENRRLNYENHEIKQRLNETPNSQNNLNIIEENRKLNVNFSEENRRLNFEIQELKKRLNESYNSQNNRNIIDENKRLNFENQDLKQRLHEASNINLNFSDENKRLLIENEDLKQKLHEPLNSPDLFEENRRLVIENQDLKYKLHDIVNSQTNTYENRRFGLENQEFKHRINEQAMYKSNSELKILKDKENYHILNNDIYDTELKKLQEKILELESKNLENLGEIDRLTSKTKEIVSELDFWKIKYKSLEKNQASQIKEALSHRPTNYLEKELSTIKQQFSLDSTLLNSLSSEKTLLTEKISILTSSLASKTQEVITLESLLQSKDSEFKELQSSFSFLEENYQGLEGILAKKEEELKKKKGKLKDLENRAEELERENERMKKDFHGKLQELDDVRRRTLQPFELEETRSSVEKLKKLNMNLREEIMRSKAEKNSIESENYALRQEIESKNKEIKNNYELYRSQKLEHETFINQSEKALKDHSQFSFVKINLEAENYSLREKAELLLHQLEETARDMYKNQLEKAREKLIKKEGELEENIMGIKKQKSEKKEEKTKHK